MFPWNMLFPFQKNLKEMQNKMSPLEIESYVQQLLSNVMPQHMQNPGNPFTQAQTKSWEKMQDNQAENYSERIKQFSADVFETHNHVYVRMAIEHSESVKNIKIFHTSNQAIIEGFPNKDDRQVLTLPAIVKKKGAIAKFKDGILEIKIPKNYDFQFSEVDVTDFG
ncbi:Hsp20/alpha crystallin family protein [Peribacillus tepidiphilus]|uniref:Hsp20/alpha crystallin family protein n=1 Tax=Peribacillus tepidiphilus TaxID=2652445 RepID=UPI0035B5096A